MQRKEERCKSHRHGTGACLKSVVHLRLTQPTIMQNASPAVDLKYLLLTFLHDRANYLSIYLCIYVSHSLGDRWGTTRSGIQRSPFLSFLCSPHGVTQFQTHPIRDVIFPSFSPSASPSPSAYSALEDCLGKSRSSCDMPIPLHFASFYSGQEFFVGSNSFPNPTSHLFVGDVVFVRDAKETYETSHFHCLYLSLDFCC